MIHLYKDGKKHGRITGSLTDVVSLWRQGFTQGGPETSAFVHRQNTSGGSWDGGSWEGGSVSGMLDACDGKMDMAPYEKARLKLAPMFRQFQAAHAGTVSKRRRTFSDSDGEYIHDRKESDKPFQHVHRARVPQKIVKVIVNMCVSGGVSAKDMDAYGAVVWAAVQLLERSGKRCEVLWRARNGDGYGTRYTVEIPLKKSDTYIAPSILAATLTTNFYRRMGFALCYYACEANGLTAPSGLGPTYFADPVAYNDGILEFCPANAYYWGGQELQDALKKALTA